MIFGIRDAFRIDLSVSLLTGKPLGSIVVFKVATILLDQDNDSS